MAKILVQIHTICFSLFLWNQTALTHLSFLHLLFKSKQKNGRTHFICKPLDFTFGFCSIFIIFSIFFFFLFVSFTANYTFFHQSHSFASRINQLHLSSTQLIFGKQSAVNQLLWHLTLALFPSFSFIAQIEKPVQSSYFFFSIKKW